jgi:hypothetical protein
MTAIGAGVAKFTDVAALRAAAARVANTEIEFTGGFVGNADGGVLGDIVAYAGGTGPILGDKITVLGPIAGTELLFGAGAQRFSGHNGTVRGVLELLGDQPLLTHARIVSAQG